MKRAGNYPCKSRRLIANATLFFFLFSIIFPGLPLSPSRVHAQSAVAYVTEYTYDLNGNIRIRTTPDNDTIEYQYDGLNRLIRKIYPDFSEVVYQYDANGNRIEMTDPSGTTYYSYDRNNRLRGVQFPGINPIYYAYDKVGNLTQITYPTGEEVIYAYDDDNRPVSVTDSTGTTLYTYDSLTGNLIQKVLPNGVVTELEYDLAKRVTDMVNKKADGTLITSYHYEYDENSNRKKVIETTPTGSKTTDYTYDKLNRLLSATASDGTYEIYTYDSSGNRLIKETQDGTINYIYDQDNRLLSAGSTYFFYDQSGNLIRKIAPDKTIQYTYEFENRLIEYFDGTNTITFEYDGDGNRISKTVNGVQKKYINNIATPITQVLFETTDQNHVINRYTYGFSRLNQINQGLVSFYLYDSPGRSVTALTNNSQDVINSYTYSGFGNISGANELTENSYKFAGEQYDEETGLIYLRARYYDPAIGRFITKDPFPGNTPTPQTSNPYPYAQNNPVNASDPEGKYLESFLDIAFIAYDIVELVRQPSWYTAAALGLDIGGLFLPGATGLGAAYRASRLAPTRTFLTEAATRAIRNVDTTGMTARNAGTALHRYAENFAGSRRTLIIEQPYLGGNPINYRAWGSNVPDVATGTAFNPTGIYDFKFGQQGITGAWETSLRNNLPASSWNVPIVEIRPYTGGYQRLTGVGSLYNVLSNDYFGGVSLSKTADLMVNIDDIAGATYDEGTGQIILYGKEDVSLPAMELDDLAVAVRSVYGYGGQAAQDPGVSIGTEPSEVAGQMKVRYDGQTFNTEFGWTMFESDRVLKTLILGKDNLTGNPVSSGVPGYMSLPNRYVAQPDKIPGDRFSNRMWFVPQEISLIQSDDDSSMVFNTVEMELLTESKFQDNVVDNPVAEEFAAHFTQHYDDFAVDTEFPILAELKRLGKITSVVKWIRDNNIPFDLSFFENYTPTNYATPEYTPETSVTAAYPGGTITMTGGVKYRLDESNFATSTDPLADIRKQAATAARPAETQFNWDFSDAGEDFTAVAHSMTRAKKDGSTRRHELDMQFPVEGNNPLALIRYYNSFNDKTYGFGYGWSLTPFQLRFTADQRSFTFGGQSLTVTSYYQIMLTKNGSEYLYSLLGLNASNQPLFARDGGQDILRDNQDGTFTLVEKNGSRINFDANGRLQSVSDNNGISIYYIYNAYGLDTITHQGGRTITLNYTGERITSAVGPGAKTITYGYDAQGRLESVTNEENETVTYAYDTDHRLIRVTDARSQHVFQANFDDYNRATSQTFGISAGYGADFRMADRLSTVTDPNSVVTNRIFDTDYRLLQWNDSEGRQVDISYNDTPGAQNYGPQTVTDPEDNSTTYGYDNAGNLNYIRDGENNEQRFLYDMNNNLAGARDARGFDTVYIYDAGNRVRQILHHAVLETDADGAFTGNYSYAPDYFTLFSYNPANGNLLSITDPEGRTVSHTYDAFGMPETTTRTSGYTDERTYDARSRLIRMENQGGEYVAYDYDGADRVILITTAAGSVAFDYDQNGNIKRVTDGRKNETHYDYDENNNLIRVVDAELGQTLYEYDLVNNLLTKITLPNGSTKEIEYDDLNRPIRIRHMITHPTPNPAVVTDTVDVGTTGVGDSTSHQLNLCNNGSAPLQITDVSTDNPNFGAEFAAPLIINPGECIDLNFTFSGAVVGQDNAIATITFADNSSIAVNLNAEVTPESLGARAVSVLDGIRISWNPYPGMGAFDHYSLYRSTVEISDISGLTPIITLSSISDTSYLDTTPEYGEEYYYCVVAFDTNSSILTAIESVGPVAKLNLGKVDDVIEAASSSRDEKAVDIAYNSVADEYLVVYAYDASGTGGNWDIYGQRISGSGAKIGGAFAIMASGYHEQNPQLAYNDAENDYLVVAEYDSNGAGHYQIIGQRVSAGGTTIGGPINILGTTTSQYLPCIAYNPLDNQYLVGFENDITGEGYRDFVRMVVNASGSVLAGQYNSLNGYHFAKPKLAYNTLQNEQLSVFELTDGSSFSYIYALRLDSNGVLVPGTDLIPIAATSFKSTYPDVVHNPDRDEYGVTWQYDSDGTANAYGVYVRKVSSAGTAGSYQYYSSAGNSLLWPAISYFDFQDEYLLSFSLLISGSEMDVMGQRLAASDLSLLTTHLIGIARESSKIEQKSRLVFNDYNNEFFVGYEYHNGSDWDVRAHRIGNYAKNLKVVPDSLDFGATLINQTVNVTEITGKTYMYLTNSTDQPWLSFPSRVDLINFTNPSINLVASVDRSGLAVGNYSGTIRIEFEGIAEVVPVTMQVVNSAPNTPSNPTPASGAEDQANLGSPLRVTMSWLSSDPDPGDQLTYDVYFSDNQNLVDAADASVRVSDDQTATSYQSPTLLYSKTYYWRVIARDSHNQSTPGPVWQFTTISVPAPVLVEYSPDPTNNKRPTLNWSAVADAAKYRVVIDENSDFSSPIVDNSNVTSNSYTLSSDLPDGVIYWHIASIDSQGLQGDFSASDDFTLDTAPPAIPTPLAYTPDPTKNLRPILTWPSVAEAQNYHIQISSVIDFQTTLVDTYVSDTFYAAAVDLPEGDIYWRLSSVDTQGNESAFSPPDGFKIDITAPAPITGLAVMQANNGARLTWGPFTDTHGDFNHFNVYRSPSPISNVSSMTPISQSITNPAAGTYLNATVAFGENYYFAVTAVDHLGNENREVTAVGPFTITRPVAVDDNYTLDEDDMLEIEAPGILANDIENDGDALTAILVDNVTRGTLTLTDAGSFIYSPHHNYHGTDAFTYKAHDGSLDSNTATVNISINSVNDAPTISGTPPTSVNEDENYGFIPTAGDADVGDNLTFSIENKPSWADFNPATGALTGTPGKTDVGTTSGIVIKVTDSHGASASLPAFDLTVWDVCPADVDHDGDVDGLDLVLTIKNLGSSGLESIAAELGRLDCPLNQ
ncbi:MAG: cadherin-like domain-containing protein [Desulfobacterales bacterium]|nr:MAG: cadherin-like domain-containing protein [Desulfobacterales bacterium]